LGSFWGLSVARTGQNSHGICVLTRLPTPSSL
jgi:hypothetical protein